MTDKDLEVLAAARLGAVELRYARRVVNPPRSWPQSYIDLKWTMAGKTVTARIERLARAGHLNIVRLTDGSGGYGLE